MSKTKNVQNANSAPITIVENLGYTNKVVKGTGTYAAIAAVSYTPIQNTEDIQPQVWRRSLLDSGADGHCSLLQKNKRRTFLTRRGTQPKLGKPRMEHLRQHM